MGDKAIDFLEKHLSPQAFGLFLLCVCAIYIWFQHLRNKLLREQIEFEKDKREAFLKELQELKKTPQSIPPPNKRSVQTTKITSKHILIVDDEPWLRDLLRVCLAQHYPDFQIDEASDGIKALDTFTSHEPSILITDAMMPHLDGFQLIKKLQLQGKTVPILMISGYVSANSFEELLSSHKIQRNKTLKFLAKPFHVNEFLKAVDSLIKR